MKNPTKEEQRWLSVQGKTIERMLRLPEKYAWRDWLQAASYLREAPAAMWRRWEHKALVIGFNAAEWEVKSKEIDWLEELGKLKRGTKKK